MLNFIGAICTLEPLARATLNSKDMKINKVNEIKDSTPYKCIIGAILDKDIDGFLVKTKDSFIKVIEYEYDGKFRVGDRFDIK